MDGLVLTTTCHFGTQQANSKQGKLMTLAEYQATVDEWIRTVGVRYYSELTNTAVLMEEVGEMARLLARLYGDQSFKASDDEANAHANLADEMADVLFVLVCLANQTGVNLTEAIERNLAKKTQRDKERHQNNPKLK
jgi:NTP pyrophosphatase (non-canonical NTP hydrolase)